MKKILTMVLSLGCVLTAMACSNGNDDVATKPETETTNVTNQMESKMMTIKKDFRLSLVRRTLPISKRISRHSTLL